MPKYMYKSAQTGEVLTCSAKSIEEIDAKWWAEKGTAKEIPSLPGPDDLLNYELGIIKKRPLTPQELQREADKVRAAVLLTLLKAGDKDTSIRDELLILLLEKRI